MKRKTTSAPSGLSRRTFIKKTVTAAGFVLTSNAFAGAPALLRNFGKPNSLVNGVQIGAITYSFRSLPCSAEHVLQYCIDANISAIELMGNTAEAFAGAPHTSVEPRPGNPGPRAQLTREEEAERAAKAKDIAAWRAAVPMEKFEQLRKMYKEKGVSIYAYKPAAFGVNNSDIEADYGMRAARALGASHVTLEMPRDPEQTKRLAGIAVKHKILVAYHGHEQQTPTFWDVALEQSGYNALNCDLGHYTAAGYDAVALIKAKHDRIASAHIKDRQNKANGKANLAWGTGDTPIREVLQTMQKNKYTFPATIELEYEIPSGSDAVKEVSTCVEYCRKALEKA